MGGMSSSRPMHLRHFGRRRGLFFGAAAVASALAASWRRTATAAPSLASAPTTLRAIYGLPTVGSLDPRRTALLLVDFQEEFIHGRLPIAEASRAVGCAASLLAWARAAAIHVAHVRNVAARADSPIFAPRSRTIEIVAPLAPRLGEPVVTKATGGAFTRTDVDVALRARGIDTMVVAGIMTHLAVDMTARDGAVLGYRVVVAEDAAATRDVPGAAGGSPIDAQSLHRATLAALADRFADVMVTRAIVALPLTPSERH